MSNASVASERTSPGAGSSGGRDIGFAVGVVLVLCLFFLPVPALLIDFGLAFSIAISVLILMVALWIQKPLEFSAFPTVLLVATVLRLALNISTTRLILSRGAEGASAAGYIIAGFARLVMGGDFVIGIIVFLILVTINFLVITKGATRIAEVGARFTLDAIPGKQMAIDADLSAGLIDDKVAQLRRRELEEESAFFGSMDGASKFVRGDAVASLIILAVNIFGGIVIGVTRHGLTLMTAGDVFTKLSVGDGLVSQIPALIISLASGLLVAKGGARGSTEKAVLGQLSAYPTALFMAAFLLFILGVVPGLPFLPFAALGGLMVFVGVDDPALAGQGAGARGGGKGGPGRQSQGGSKGLAERTTEADRNRAVLQQGAVRHAAGVLRRNRQPRRQDAPQVCARIRLRGAGNQAQRRDQRAGKDLSDQDSWRYRGVAGTQGAGRARHRRRRSAAAARPVTKCASLRSA